MIRWLLRRLLLSLVTLWLLASIVFIIANVLPNDVGRTILGPFAPQESVDALNERLGTNDPLPEQYIRAMRNLVTFDMGGTSADVAVIEGEPRYSTENHVGDFPVIMPAIDVTSIGAGGGSIAWTDSNGVLKVGPTSAGAKPGPACYGKGGTEVTVTDAHAVLGRIPPHLLGGEIPLDIEAARRGLTDLAGRLGLDTARCAVGILEIGNRLSIPAVPSVSSRAEAAVGRPLTPVSVAGVARRTARRCAAGVYDC